MNAALDQNSKQTAVARLKSNGVSLIRLTADPVTGSLDVTAITTGAVVPKNLSGTDDNGRTSWFVVSEDNPRQLVALQCDSAGALLVKVI